MINEFRAQFDRDLRNGHFLSSTAVYAEHGNRKNYLLHKNNPPSLYVRLSNGAIFIPHYFSFFRITSDNFFFFF
jgi:hypothetical protein